MTDALKSASKPARGLRILVNASAMRDAGGRSVAMNFLRAVSEVARRHTFEAIVPHGVGYEALASQNVRIHSLSPLLSKGVARLAVDLAVLPRLTKAHDADCVFSMGNFGFPSGRRPQLVLFHWPYALYPESAVWRRMTARQRIERRIRLRYLRLSLRCADAVAAQTATAARRLEKNLGVAGALVVPNAVSLSSVLAGESEGGVAYELDTDVRWLLCLSRYYPHKNIEILLDVADEFRRRGMPYGIVTTFEASNDRAAATILAEVARRGLHRHFRNLGAIRMGAVPSLYRRVHALLLPTLLESFSGTYVEAMHFGVPVCTSDMDFARDVCADAGWYFNPLSADSIVEVVQMAFADAAELRRRVDLGKTRAAAFPDWNLVAGMYVAELERLVRRA